MEPFKIFKFETKYNCVLILKTGETINPYAVNLGDII